MGGRLHLLHSAAHVLSARSLLPPNHREVVHNEIAADVFTLIADGKDRDWDAAVSDGEIDAQVSALTGRRCGSCAGRAIVEVHTQGGNGADAGNDISGQRVIARRQRDVLCAVIHQAASIGLEPQRVLSVGDQFRVRYHDRAATFDEIGIDAPAAVITSFKTWIDDHVQLSSRSRRWAGSGSWCRRWSRPGRRCRRW